MIAIAGTVADSGTKVVQFAQLIVGNPARASDGVIVGTDIACRSDISVTTSPGKAGDIISGETNTTVCPGSISPGQSLIGTRIGANGSLHVAVTASGGSGSVTGFRSGLTAGGPDCK
jgi:hypothetical protein